MKNNWESFLMEYVENIPLILLRLSRDEWERLEESRGGYQTFSTAFPHQDDLRKLKLPAVCIAYCRGQRPTSVLLGLVRSCNAVTTLHTRIKFIRGIVISPSKESDLLNFVVDPRHRANLNQRVQAPTPAVCLSPKLGSHMIQRLATQKDNHCALQSVFMLLKVPKTFSDIAALQEDALRTALATIGISSLGNGLASKLQFNPNRSTGLARVGIVEDAVIELDARAIKNYKLKKADITGRAVFANGTEQLEVITANRRQLEKCLGADLIFLNVSRQALVMVQYKMLERTENDWIYRPDDQLKDELKRMRAFEPKETPDDGEFRLHPGLCYLKFVKRDSAIRSGGVILHLQHFERFCQSRNSLGPKGGVRISYKSLDGSYLRHRGFIELLESGYIGSKSKDTADLSLLIQAVLDENRAVIAAIRSRIPQR